MNFYLKDFYIFINVVETGSLSKTAMMMGLSISSVSKRLSRLEEHLNTTLLERNTRSVKLSPLGERAYVKSKEITQTFSDFIEDIRIGGGTRLNVFLNYTNAFIPLVEWIYEYSSRRDKPSFSIHTNLSKRPSDMLLINDIVISTEPSTSPMAIHRKLIEFKRTICINPKFNVETEINKLDETKLVFYSPYINERLVLNDVVNKRNIALKASINTDDADVALKLIMDNNVIVFGLPEHITEKLCREGILKQVMTEWMIEPINYYLIWKGRKFYKEEFTDFIEYLENRLNEFLSTKH